jgi:hypothetical protein
MNLTCWNRLNLNSYFVLFLFARPKLTTAKIEAARATAVERTIATG